MLLTSNLRSIDHIEVNKWTIKHGAEWGIRPERLLHDADDTFVKWTVRGRSARTVGTDRASRLLAAERRR